MSLRQSLSGRAMLSARTPDGSGDVWPSVRKGALQTPRKNTTVAEFIASDKNRSFSTKKKRGGESGCWCLLQAILQLLFITTFHIFQGHGGNESTL